VLQTKVDAQCDKLATELNRQRLRPSTFSELKRLICRKSLVLTHVKHDGLPYDPIQAQGQGHECLKATLYMGFAADMLKNVVTRA